MMQNIFDENQLKTALTLEFINHIFAFWPWKFRYQEIFSWKIDIRYHFF